MSSSTIGASDQGFTGLPVTGVQVISLPFVPDVRGNLVVAEFGGVVPFQVKRVFAIFGVPTAKVRGEHAHRTLHQLLICLRGSCSVVVDDGRRNAEVMLDRPDVGIYVPPMIWATQHQYSGDAILFVCASEHYDPADYIRSYDEFLALRAAERR